MPRQSKQGLGVIGKGGRLGACIQSDLLHGLKFGFPILLGELCKNISELERKLFDRWKLIKKRPHLFLARHLEVTFDRFQIPQEIVVMTIDGNIGPTL